MAGATKRLQAVRIVGVLVRLALQRPNVIALKPPGPAALDTTVAVALEHAPSGDRPAVRTQVGVTTAQAASLIGRVTLGPSGLWF